MSSGQTAPGDSIRERLTNFSSWLAQVKARNGLSSTADSNAQQFSNSGANAPAVETVAATQFPNSGSNDPAVGTEGGDEAAEEVAQNFPSRLDAAYLASVRLADGNGAALFIDTGSPNNICGSEWSREMAEESSKFGFYPEYARRERPMRCSGSPACERSSP